MPSLSKQSTTRLLVPRLARFGRASGDGTSIPAAPFAHPDAAPPSGVQPPLNPSTASPASGFPATQERLLGAWSQGVPLDRIVALLADSLADTWLAPTRLSLVIIPAYATLEGLQWVWRASERARVECHQKSIGFLDAPEHLVSPLHTVLETNRPLRERPSAESAYPFLRDLAAAGVTDYVAIPLPHRASAPSVLSLATHREGGWPSDPIPALWALASVLGLMVEVSEGQRLLQLAASDPLTGLANRRSFDHALRRAWALCQRSAAPLSIAYFDIDFFKRFNDGYGHGAGDRCIAQVASAAASGASLRATDSVARLGGEEFGVLLPSCHPHGALAVGERLRAAIERLGVRHAFSAVSDRVTISVGTATLVPHEGGEHVAARRAGRRGALRGQGRGTKPRRTPRPLSIGP